MIDANLFPPDESGYEAWLRYPKVTDSERRTELAKLRLTHCSATGICAQSALNEWQRGLNGFMAGYAELTECDPSSAGVRFSTDTALPKEGYRVYFDGALNIVGGSANGLLYGTFAALRELSLGMDPRKMDTETAPHIPLRMLNHWDNLSEDPVMGSIERIKGGKTIFDWTDLTHPNPRYEDYARMLASIGINGICINNVNATAEILSPAMLPGLAGLATIFRAWGIQLFLSVDFASPVDLGGIPTADPLDERVAAWWCKTANEIFAAIPDFGGFVVKADSEGRPGPGDYGRSHIEGSRCMARALAPHGGTLIWRAFVYGRNLSSLAPHKMAAQDRANHASYEFMHLDGQFDANVILQIKRSATDFQIWEPPHALLGKMPNTRICLEFDLTHEYTGHDVHMAWEGPYLAQILNFDMAPQEGGRRVADIVAGHTGKHLPGGVTAVANTSNARNWFGHLLAGAGLYAHGRMAWDPAMSVQLVSAEYAGLLFGDKAAPAVADMLNRSYATCGHYMCPLGAGFLYESLHHFEPDPWSNQPTAGITPHGIGRDRTETTGSAHTALFAPPHSEVFADSSRCPEPYLLYFHHLPWHHRMPDGRTLIQAIYDSCHNGAEVVREFREIWRSLFGTIDLSRWSHVYDKLALQIEHAERWRDLLCRFFLETSNIPDEHARFNLRSPSPHARLRSGFEHAVEDYRARVERMRARIGAKTCQESGYH